MNNISFLKAGVASAAMALMPQVARADEATKPNGVVMGSTTAAQETSGGKVKPNFVIVIADDLSWHDIGCYGNKDVRTPNLDKLASQGVRFTRFYSPAAMCAPVRQALYTGIYPVKNGAYPNHSNVYPNTKSIPHYLKPLGYRVGLVGKTHFGPRENFPFEFPRSGAVSGAANAKAVKAGKGGEGAPGKKAKKTAAEAGDDGEGAELPLDFAAAEQFMCRDKAQPFCLVVTPHEPHAKWDQGDSSVYQQDKLWLPPYLADTPRLRAGLAKYYAEVNVLDQEVGKVMAMLEKNGLADNTLIVFCSEQGSSVPFGKWTLYEAGIHAGVIARWPAKIKPGSESAALLSYVDLLPTFVDAAGGKAPDGIDGKSFLKVLTGETDKGDECVFAEQTSRGIMGGRNQLFGIRCVRDGRYKLILNLNPESEMQAAAVVMARSWLRADNASARELGKRYLKRPPLELYDLDQDPWEMKNLADDPSHAGTLKKLRDVLDAWMKQQGDLGAETEAAALSRQGKAKQTATSGGAEKTKKKNTGAEQDAPDESSNGATDE